MTRPALPHPQTPKRRAEVVLCRGPEERHPIARSLLERRATSRDRLFQMTCPALSLSETLERGAEVVLRRRPVERIATARLLLQRGAVGRNRLLQSRRPALPIAQRPERAAEANLRPRPVDRGGGAVGRASKRTVTINGKQRGLIVPALIPLPIERPRLLFQISTAFVRTRRWHHAGRRGVTLGCSIIAQARHCEIAALSLRLRGPQEATLRCLLRIARQLFRLARSR